MSSGAPVRTRDRQERLVPAALAKHTYTADPPCVPGLGGQERVELFGGLGASGGGSDGGFAQRRARKQAAAPARAERALLFRTCFGDVWGRRLWVLVRLVAGWFVAASLAIDNSGE